MCKQLSYLFLVNNIIRAIHNETWVFYSLRIGLYVLFHKSMQLLRVAQLINDNKTEKYIFKNKRANKVSDIVSTKAFLARLTRSTFPELGSCHIRNNIKSQSHNRYAFFQQRGWWWWKHGNSTCEIGQRRHFHSVTYSDKIPNPKSYYLIIW